ncbi:MAG: adenylosuccinate lyase [Chloroflexi bacterium]|nr:adenylosuccinate lyase [Chloroflexota bacterium]
MIDRYSRPEMKFIWSESHKYELWLNVEIAVCEAWHRQGVIPLSEWELLRNSYYDPLRMNEIFEITRHDMTAFTRSITDHMGDEGRWIHFGITSNDVIDTAQNLQLKESVNIIRTALIELRNVVKLRSIEYKKTIMIGRTHGIHAEPITFGLKLANWWVELGRCIERLDLANKQISVGKISGAVGTYATLNPDIEKFTCETLGIEPDPISNQIVQRDRHAFLLSTFALIAASLEKFALEIRHLQRTEVREAEEPFGEGQTGSSAMPHKRNPELTERVCGIARLIRGNSITAMENVALWHERDISHSSAERIILPDSCLALDYIIDISKYVISGLKVFPENMLRNLKLTKGVVFSQRVLLALLDAGMSREDGYEIIQRNAHKSWDSQEEFRDNIENDISVTNVLTADDLDELFDYNYYLKYVESIFERINIERN